MARSRFMLCVLLAGTLAACAPAAPSASRVGQVEAPASRPVAAARPLTVALLGEPRVLSATLDNTAGSPYNVHEFVSHGLTSIDAQGAAVPMLLAEIPSLDRGTWRLPSDGAMETTYRLRPNLRWHDGTPITVEDVVFSRSAFTDNGLVDVPQVAGVETSYGIECQAHRPGQSVRLTHHSMPNILHIKSSPDEDGSGWTDALAWRVPIDDTSHVSLNVTLAHVSGAARDRYEERMRSRQGAGPSPVNDLAFRILAGELHIDDLGQPPYIVGVQDTVAQVGQGALADRVHERPGRSDSAILLLRHIWARELQALAEGRPLTAWSRPARVEATAGV